MDKSVFFTLKITSASRNFAVGPKSNLVFQLISAGDVVATLSCREKAAGRKVVHRVTEISHYISAQDPAWID
jgi:hypothetical protein